MRNPSFSPSPPSTFSPSQTPRATFAAMRRYLARRYLVCLLLFWGSFTLASPSAFPETAAYFSVGYNGTLVGSVGGEYAVSTRYADASLDLIAYADIDDLYGARLSGTALIFPALGTEPPLALGLGADVGVDSRETQFHVGVVVGNDLLFVFDVPMTISGYLAPGYSFSKGFSLAWALQVRYYFRDVALEVASTDLLPVSVGVRYLF